MKIVRYLNNTRLALFSIAYGLSGALIGGTLNRIMIADLGLPASLVAFFFAVPLLISPVRVWLGYRSDGFPIFGKRREPYIVLGAIGIGLGIIAASNVAVTATKASALLVLSGILSFLLYGLGRNLAHNTYQALISDRYTGTYRTRAVTFYEVATLLGSVIGAGFIGKALETFESAKLMSRPGPAAAADPADAGGHHPRAERARGAAEAGRAPARGREGRLHDHDPRRRRADPRRPRRGQLRQDQRPRRCDGQEVRRAARADPPRQGLRGQPLPSSPTRTSASTRSWAPPPRASPAPPASRTAQNPDPKAKPDTKAPVDTKAPDPGDDSGLGGDLKNPFGKK